MVTKYERDIYLFLSLYRFFAYGLAVILIQGLLLEDAASRAPLRTFVLLSLLGVYTLLKVVGPLRWWQRDPTTYIVLGGDALVCIFILLFTSGLDSPYLLYSLMSVVTASLLFQEKLALSGAALFSLAVVLAHLTPALWSTNFTWIMQGNYLLWLVLYVASTFLIASIVYRTNLNIRRRIESDAVQEERRRIRREIHDGLAQTLTYLGMKIESVGRLIADKRPSEAQAALEEVRSLAEDSYQEARESIDELAVDTLPLIPALNDYVEEFGQASGIQTEFEGSTAGFEPPPAAEFQFLRIIQEALANIRRHAQATRAWVTLGSTSESVELLVRDNGRGFVLGNTRGNGPGHHGLKVMRERAESLGGTLDITSGPGRGTEVLVRVPRGRFRR